jgi:CheY-like chemotaxis protein
MKAISKESMEDSGKFFVLVADDDATSRTLLASRVHRLGHAIATAASGTEAWEVFESTRPNLVVADWQMPGIDGLALCQRIRAQVGDECFIMIVTASDADEDVQAALAAGADDYLPKPVTSSQFRARVVIAQRQLALARARRIAEEEAARMRWLAGIGQTVLTVQHEINNPLTALYGSLDALLVAPLHAADRAHAERAAAQAGRIADVVKRLSRIEQPATVELIPGMPMIALPEKAEITDEYPVMVAGD